MITLNGIALELLEATHKDIQKDATKQVAQLLSEVKANVGKIVEGDASLISETEEKAKLVRRISNVSGVEYYLPWDYEYEDVLSRELEGAVEDVDDDGEEREVVLDYKQIRGLLSVLGDLEYQSKQWHQSTC